LSGGQTSEHHNGEDVPEMMDGMYGIGVAMMIIGSVTALAVLTLIVLATVWLARDLSIGKR